MSQPAPQCRHELAVMSSQSAAQKRHHSASSASINAPLPAIGSTPGLKPADVIEQIVDGDAAIRGTRSAAVVHIRGDTPRLEQGEVIEQVVDGHAAITDSGPRAVIDIGNTDPVG